MSVYDANPMYDGRQAAMAPGPGPVGPHGRRGRAERPREPEHERRQAARTGCDLVIFLSQLAAIAFIIAGLATATWIYYGPSTVAPYANRGLFTYCGQTNTSSGFVSFCSWLDLGNSSVTSDQLYWNVIGMRRVVVAFCIIAVALTGISVIVHAFCCVPSCRRRTRHGFWKNSIASGILSALAASIQIIGMIIFQADMYYEAVYAGTNCVECYSLWSTTVKSQVSINYGVGYALGWAAAGLLAYASYAYLSRETCVVRNCKPPASEPDEFQNLETVSGISSSAPYIKGSAREFQFGQIQGAPRLQRYDVGTMRSQQVPPGVYAAPYGRSDMVY